MPLKAILYVVLYCLTVLGGLVYHPYVAIIGYFVVYCVNPRDQWWAASLGILETRFSFILAVCIIASFFIHLTKLRFEKFLEFQEILMVMFLVSIWVSIPLGLGYTAEGSNAEKMSKIFLVIFIASHVVTDLKKYEIFMITIVVVNLYLGYALYNAPSNLFMGGRFHAGIGGTDFQEGNFLAAHLAAFLPLTGLLFLKGGRKTKILCFLSGVFSVNGMILVRSRGVFMATALGAAASVFFAPKKYRTVIVIFLIVGGIGAVLLTDPNYWLRMQTVSMDEVGEDQSAYGRILAWTAAWEMFADHPFGIGEGNFKKYVGTYNPDIPGKDTHNLFLRCLAELGIVGFLLLMSIIFWSFLNLIGIEKRVKEKRSEYEKEFLFYSLALKIGILIYLMASLFITTLYIEEMYWLLFFPVFLKRCYENSMA